MFSVQSVHFWVGIINQGLCLKVELSLAEKPLLLMGKALTVWQFRSLCSACVPICNTIVLMKDSATILQRRFMYVCDCIILLLLYFFLFNRGHKRCLTLKEISLHFVRCSTKGKQSYFFKGNFISTDNAGS